MHVVDLKNQVFPGRLSDPESNVLGKNSRWGILSPGEQDFADAVAGRVVHAVPVMIKKAS